MANIKPLPVELQKIAEKELNEVPEKIPEYLQSLRSWIEQQPHLNARLDDQFLIQFLRNSKYNLDVAKEKLHFFFTLKTKFPEFINVIDVLGANFQKAHNSGWCIPLPRPLNDNGPRIIFLKFDSDVAKGLLDINDVYSVLMTLNEIMIMDDPYACINGIMYILDVKEVNTIMASKFTPLLLQKLVQSIEHSIPLRIISAHLINMTPVFQSVMDIMLPMLSEDLRQRYKFYGENYDDLYKIIPKKYLPIEYGGENGDRIQLVKDFNKKWLEYENYFKENSNYGTNEQLRPGKPIDINSLYGLGGTSRKLQLN